MSRPTYVSGKPAMALNAISSISIQGLASCNDGTPVTVEVKRTSPDSRKTSMHEHRYANEPARVVELLTPPSTLPPDGDIRLELEIGDVISQNSRNLVYDLRIANADTLCCYVPPLVMQVATLFKGRNLSEEAGMYQDLERLQGSVVPRCYGYFRATLDHTQLSVLPWDGPDCTYPRGPHTFDPHDPAPVGASEHDAPGAAGRLDSDRQRLESETIRQELFDIQEELAEYGVSDEDWDLRNLLHAPPSPPGLPGLKPPNHDRV